MEILKTLINAHFNWGFAAVGRLWRVFFFILMPRDQFYFHLLALLHFAVLFGPQISQYYLLLHLFNRRISRHFFEVHNHISILILLSLCFFLILLFLFSLQQLLLFPTQIHHLNLIPNPFLLHPSKYTLIILFSCISLFLFLMYSLSNLSYNFYDIHYLI